jgi:hypothetical protein
MSRRKPMNPDNGEAERELSAQQALAVDLIAAGRSLTEAAALVGLTRQTLSGWNQTPRFRAALNMRREELWSASVDQLRGLLPAAVEAVASELRQGGWPAPIGWSGVNVSA